MDADDARRDLDEARISYELGARPPLPGWAPPACGVLVAAAIALDGLAPESIWLRLAGVAGGIVLGVAALLLLQGVRTQQGVRGVRGPARKERAGLVTMAAFFVIVGLGAAESMRYIMAGLGVVAGLAVWVALGRRAARR
ncbi:MULTISPECIES: hypothetical protein [unclassified Kitasatospora]|uniref:hypothetical protein n=1 Tax=unclassified Kitasatospora TaxID=2633591 RepID=UPI0033D5FD04